MVVAPNPSGPCGAHTFPSPEEVLEGSSQKKGHSRADLGPALASTSVWRLDRMLIRIWASGTLTFINTPKTIVSFTQLMWKYVKGSFENKVYAVCLNSAYDNNKPFASWHVNWRSWLTYYVQNSRMIRHHRASSILWFIQNELKQEFKCILSSWLGLMILTPVCPAGTCIFGPAWVTVPAPTPPPLPLFAGCHGWAGGGQAGRCRGGVRQARPCAGPLRADRGADSPPSFKAEVRSNFFTTTVREQHKGATGRFRTADQRYPVLCRSQLGQDIFFELRLRVFWGHAHAGAWSWAVRAWSGAGPAERGEQAGAGWGRTGRRGPPPVGRRRSRVRPSGRLGCAI